MAFLGKAYLWLVGTAILFLIGYATVPSDANPSIANILWYIFVALSAMSLLTGGGYLYLLVKKRLNPLAILDEIRCTYWSKEKQLQVLLWICDYSHSAEFRVLCLARFGSQIVNVNEKIQLDGYYLGNTYCKGGRKRMVEFRKNDVEVRDASQCLVTVSMKPLGIWATKKRSEEIATLVVNR